MTELLGKYHSKFNKIMSKITLGEKEYFKGIGKIQYEGPENFNFKVYFSIH